MASRPSCLAEELWRAPSRRPTSSGRWDIKATWSRSDGGAVALGVHGSRPSMTAGGLERGQIPSSLVRRCAWMGGAHGGKWSEDLTRC
jgi:hypothetical protein